MTPEVFQRLDKGAKQQLAAVETCLKTLKK